MSRRLLALLGGVVVAGLIVLGFHFSTAPPALRVRVGEPIPDLELPDFTDRGRLRLSSLRDKPLVIVVFDTGWPATVPYLKQIEKLRALYQDRGLIVVAISTDTEKDALDAVMRTEQVYFYVLRDPGGVVTRTVFGSPTPPTPDTFVVAPGGRVAGVFAEVVDWRNAFQRKVVESVLPPPQSTFPTLPPGAIP